VERLPLDLKDPVSNTDDVPSAFFLSKRNKKIKKATSKAQTFKMRTFKS